MDAKLIKQYGDELYHAMQSKQAVAPLTARESDISIEDAYHISLQILNRRIDAGAQVIGKKIGVTSKAVQSMLNVHQPDFGYLTDDMVFNQGEVMPISERLIAPKAEGELKPAHLPLRAYDVQAQRGRVLFPSPYLGCRSGSSGSTPSTPILQVGQNVLRGAGISPSLWRVSAAQTQ